MKNYRVYVKSEEGCNWLDVVGVEYSGLSNGMISFENEDGYIVALFTVDKIVGFQRIDTLEPSGI